MLRIVKGLWALSDGFTPKVKILLLTGLITGMGISSIYSEVCPVPVKAHFSKVVLSKSASRSIDMTVLPDRRVIYVEHRTGNVMLIPASNGPTASIKIGTINIYYEQEEGLLGVVSDPNFTKNGWLYFNYRTGEGAEARHEVARYTLAGNKLVTSSRKILIQVPRYGEAGFHSGGGLGFGPRGNLFISEGDNTNSWKSGGYAPLDMREGREWNDAQATSANTMDLRGKILRIRPIPLADGVPAPKPGPGFTYEIPDGNFRATLDPAQYDLTKVRPEIYSFGHRNPWRFSVDSKTGWVVVGDVGPDSHKPSEIKGPQAYDEINLVKKPGYFGWPYMAGPNIPYRDYEFGTTKQGPNSILVWPLPSNMGKGSIF